MKDTLVDYATIFFVAFFFIGYLLPSIIAVMAKRRPFSIFVATNIFLGWTIIVYLIQVAMIWRYVRIITGTAETNRHSDSLREPEDNQAEDGLRPMNTTEATALTPETAEEGSQTMSKYSRLLSDENAIDFIEGIENKILERGLLTETIGTNDFSINLSLQEYSDHNDKPSIKFVLDIETEESNISLTADQCDEIQDMLISYFYEKGWFEVVDDAGLSEDDGEVEWVHVSINGKFLFD
jgi:hypothetical protein